MRKFLSILVLLLLLPFTSQAWTNGFNAPLMGWNHFDYYQQNINATIVSNTAWAFHTNGLQAAGYVYINIDAYWSDGTTNALGVPNPDPAKFPNGMAAVATYVHSLGLKFGLYCQWDTCCLKEMAFPNWTNVINQFAAWGVDYCMNDFIDNVTVGVTAQQQITALHNAILGCGRPMLFAVDRMPVFSWAPPLVNRQRTSPDPDGTWATVLGAMDDYNTQAGLYATLGFWPDPSLLQIETNPGNLTTNEYRSHFAFCCVAGAPLELSHNGTNLSAFSMNLVTNSELIAINQDPKYMTGLRKSRLAGTGGNMDVWGKTNMSSVGVDCYNGTSGTTNITFNFTTYGLGSIVFIRDAVNHVDIGLATNSFTATNILTHDSKVFVLTRPTWYVDLNAPGPTHDGKTWTTAWLNPTNVDWSVMGAGDDIELSGGTGGVTYDLANTGYAWRVNVIGGVYGDPMNIHVSQAAGHNGKVTIAGKVTCTMDWVTFSGAKSDVFDTNLFENTFMVTNCVTNINLVMDATLAPGECALKSTGSTQTGLNVRWVELMTSYESGSGSASGYEMGANWVTNSALSYCNIHRTSDFGVLESGNSQPAYDNLVIDHCWIHDIGADGVRMSGGVTVHHCIIADVHSTSSGPFGYHYHPNAIFSVGNYARIYNNVMHGWINSFVYFGLNGSTNCHDVQYYGNLGYPCPHVISALSQSIFIGTDEDYHLVVGTNGPFISNYLFANNSMFCNPTNGPAGDVSVGNREWNFGITDVVQTTGIVMKNNLRVSKGNGANIVSSGIGQPAPGSGFGTWKYDNTKAIVDYQVAYNDTSATSWYWNTNAVTNVAGYKALSGFQSNYFAEPTFMDISNYSMNSNADYRLSVADTVAKGKGVDLSSLNLPGWTNDLWGVRRGLYGAPSIGALEPSGLVMWLDFADTNWVTSGIVADASGNSANGVQFSATNWPTSTNGPNAGMKAAQYRPITAWQQDVEAHNIGDYIGVTNVSGFYYLTNGTISVRSWCGPSSYGGTTLIDAMSVGGIGTAGHWTNSWSFANRRGNENFRFVVMEPDGSLTNLIVYPDDTIGHGSGANGFTQTNWAMLTVTFDQAANTVIGYYNGVAFQTNTFNRPWIRICDLSLEGGVKWVGIGVVTHNGTPQMDYPGVDRYPNNGWTAGGLADIRIYNRALPPSEISTMYTYSPGASSQVSQIPAAVFNLSVIKDVIIR